MKTAITHPFPPFYDAGSRILILGSFPSVKSREQLFFYGHPQQVLEGDGGSVWRTGSGEHSGKKEDAGK